ncbi:hypothetical protein KIPB_012374, partial [Kipferlia bialata]
IKGMHLTDLNLEECDISELDLTGCHLTKCNLRKIEGAATLATTASLAGSDLRGLCFDRLDLCSVDLKGADLTECTLYRTQFTRDLVMGAKFSMCMDVQWLAGRYVDDLAGATMELKYGWNELSFRVPPCNGTSWTITSEGTFLCVDVPAGSNKENRVSLGTRCKLRCTRGKTCIRIGNTTVGCTPGEATKVNLSVHCKDDSGQLVIEQELLNPSE